MSLTCFHLELFLIEKKPERFSLISQVTLKLIITFVIAKKFKIINSLTRFHCFFSVNFFSLSVCQNQNNKGISLLKL